MEVYVIPDLSKQFLRSFDTFRQYCDESICGHWIPDLIPELLSEKRKLLLLLRTTHI